MSKRLGAMQPYLFPYLGYFQLIAGTDVFVLSEDLQYINKGWINRNRILVHGQPQLFTFPLAKACAESRINQRELAANFDRWRERFLMTLGQSYIKAPYSGETYPLIERIVRHPATNLARYIENSLCLLCAHLSIGTQLLPSSELRIDDGLEPSDWIVAAARKLRATTYINPIGGTELYDHAYFEQHGLELKFHCMDDISYRQFRNPFVPRLSIIDVLMFNGQRRTRELLERYTLQEKKEACHEA